MSSLPTPRQLLTSIVNAISEIPAPAPAPEDQTHTHAAPSTTDPQGGRHVTRNAPTASNPLKAIGPAHRPLFTTLHVLFPSLLLPALDLLDRGLVTRLTRGAALAPASAPAPRPPPHGQVRSRHDRGDDMDITMTDDATTTATSNSAPAFTSQVYQVRSAQNSSSSSSRRPFRRGEGDAAGTGSSGLGQTSYIVHTAAWNCTCAAFVFAAFPPLAPSAPPGRDDAGAGAGGGGGIGREMEEKKKKMKKVDENEEEEEDDDDDEGPGAGTASCWQFGGLSLDGVDDDGGGGVPPCCKHLLACVLAERWDAVLGPYVKERQVRREEMAGAFADI